MQRAKTLVDQKISEKTPYRKVRMKKRSLSSGAGGVFSSPHIDGLRRVHRPGSAVGLRSEVGMSRLQVQMSVDPWHKALATVMVNDD